MAEFTITANSIPILDKDGWDNYWNIAEWQKWHGLVKDKYGKAEAKKQFLFWWEKQDATASPYNWAKYSPGFVDYLKKNDIDISNFVSKLLLGATNTAGNLGEAAEETSKGAKNTAKVLKVVIPIAVTLIILLILYIIYKKYTKTT